MQRGSYTKFFLTLALIMDIVGLLLFFIGIFAPLSFWDFFVISGPLLIFLSLVLWIFWYIGNLTVSEEDYGHPKWSVGALKTLSAFKRHSHPSRQHLCGFWQESGLRPNQIPPKGKSTKERCVGERLLVTLSSGPVQSNMAGEIMTSSTGVNEGISPSSGGENKS
uniref:Uncharacterized protein n=1 Tax=Cynoglossus semilaevis TaxID=244447 RepID=A0A3P8WZB8_CYNSE